MFGRIEIEPNHILEFLNKLLIVGELKKFAQMRF